ncbi:hypothetical protein TeGR_g11592, partial [Tetraparma gracilis]
YLDGVQVFTQERYSNTLSLATALATMTYGTYADNAGDFVNLDVANDHLNGYLDEVALYSKALTAAEIAAAWQAPLDTDDSDLVVYFNFDDGCPGNECANLGQAGDEMDMLLGSNFKGSKRLGPATGTATPGIGGAVCRLVTDGPIVFCDDATGPAVVGSGAPISGDGKPFVAAAIAGGDQVTFTLPGADSAGAALTFAVGDDAETGTVAVDPATGVATYTADVGASGTDTFTYTVEAGGVTTSAATVTVILAEVPTAHDVAVSLVEDRSAKIILNPSDPMGLDTTCAITALPAGGSITLLDGNDAELSVITSSDLPKDIGLGLRLTFQPNENEDAVQTFEYTVTNSAGQTSAAGSVSLTIFLDNDMSEPVEGAATEMPDGADGVSITVDTVDPDNTFVNIMVSALPTQGSLYYSAGDSSEPVTAFSEVFQPPTIQQYVADVVECGTFWPSDSGQWGPAMVVGPPSEGVVGVYGDSGLTIAYYSRSGTGGTGCPDDADGNPTTCTMINDLEVTITALAGGSSGYNNGGDTLVQTADLPITVQHNALCGYSITQSSNTGDGPFVVGTNFDPDGVKVMEAANDCWNGAASLARGDGFNEFFTAKFETEVYIKDIEFGENRGMGAITSIEAYDRNTDSWMVMWSGEPDVEKEQV